MSILMNRIMNVKTIYFYEVAKFMHSVFHNYSPEAFQTYFQLIDHTHNTRWRQNISYRAPQPRTERGKRSIRYYGIDIWAQVPEHLRTLEPKQFNHNIREYIFSNDINFNFPTQS